MKSLIDSLGIQLIGWSDLQHLQEKQIGNHIIENEYYSQPKHFELQQNFPNPFNPLTTIIYKLPITNYVELTIFNLIGQKVATLVSEYQPAGIYKAEWDANAVAAGVYYYRLKVNDFLEVKKMALIR